MDIKSHLISHGDKLVKITNANEARQSNVKLLKMQLSLQLISIFIKVIKLYHKCSV